MLGMALRGWRSSGWGVSSKDMRLEKTKIQMLHLDSFTLWSPFSLPFMAKVFSLGLFGFCLSKVQKCLSCAWQTLRQTHVSSYRSHRGTLLKEQLTRASHARTTSPHLEGLPFALSVVTLMCFAGELLRW